MTTDKPGHPPSLIRVFTVGSVDSYKDLSCLHVDIENTSDRADAQADMSVC